MWRVSLTHIRYHTIYHDEYYDDSTITVGFNSVNSNNICIYEVNDGETSWDVSRIRFEIRSGSSSDFETGVFIKEGVKNEYEDLGSMYDGDEDSFDVNTGDDDVLFFVVRPKNSHSSFFMDITHEGEGGFKMPWWGIMLCVICGLLCCCGCCCLWCKICNKKGKAKAKFTSSYSRPSPPPRPR